MYPIKPPLLCQSLFRWKRYRIVLICGVRPNRFGTPADIARDRADIAADRLDLQLDFRDLRGDFR